MARLDHQEWANRYWEQEPAVRANLSEGWSMYGEAKDAETPRFIAWRELPDGKYEFKDVTPA